MRRPLGNGHLQAVVVGLVQVRQAVDLPQVRELAKERPLQLRRAYTRLAGVAGEAAWVPRSVTRQNLVHHWIGRPKARIRSTQGRLVEVPEAQQFSAMVANIGNLQGHVVRDRSLDGQGPSADVGCSQIRIHRLRVAGCRIWFRCSRYGQAIAALEREKAGGEDAAAGSSPTSHTGSGWSLPTRCKQAAVHAVIEYPHVARAPSGDLSAATHAGV